MDAHDKECALAAFAFLIEKAEKNGTRADVKELRATYRKILAEPVEIECNLPDIGIPFG